MLRRRSLSYLKMPSDTHPDYQVTDNSPVSLTALPTKTTCCPSCGTNGIPVTVSVPVPVPVPVVQQRTKSVSELHVPSDGTVNVAFEGEDVLDTPANSVAKPFRRRKSNVTFEVDLDEQRQVGVLNNNVQTTELDTTTVELDDEFDDSEPRPPGHPDKVITTFQVLNDHLAPPIPSAAYRRNSFAKRASISIGDFRRKSVDVTKHVVSSYRGIILAMTSSVFFTLTAVIVKYLRDIHPGQMACFRFMGILLFTIPMVITSGSNPFGPRDKRHFLILRGLSGASSLYLRYAALQMLPIANATIIVLSMPVFVCIFARVFLKEPCGIFHVVAIGVTLLGIGFTSKLNVLVGLSESAGVDKEKEMWGLIYSMAATLVGSAAYILVRKVKDVHSSVILLNFSVVAIIETSIITAALDGFKLPDCGLAPWLLTLLAVLSFYAQLMLTKALQVEEASLVSVTRSSMEVVCAFIFQIVIFQEIPEWTAFVGAFLVSTSVMLTSARKWVGNVPDNHWGKRYLGFTLR